MMFAGLQMPSGGVEVIATKIMYLAPQATTATRAG